MLPLPLLEPRGGRLLISLLLLAQGGAEGGWGVNLMARAPRRATCGERGRVCLCLYLGGRCGAALALARGGRRLISLLRLGGA